MATQGSESTKATVSNGEVKSMTFSLWSPLVTSSEMGGCAGTNDVRELVNMKTF